MVAGFLLYAPRRLTIFEAYEQKGVAGMSTVALRSSSGWSYPVLSAGALAGALGTLLSTTPVRAARRIEPYSLGPGTRSSLSCGCYDSKARQVSTQEEGWL